MKMQLKKRSRASKAAAFMQMSADSKQQSRDKKDQNRRRMRVIQLQRSLERKEKELRAFPKHPVPEKPKREKGPLQPHEWKLKGAARPAAMLARIAAGELDQEGNEIPKPIETFDLFKQTMQEGKMAINPNTREYLIIMKQLADACCQARMSDRGIQHYQKCMKLDKEDTLRSREGLACALIDEGRGDEARALVDKYNGSASAVLAYCRVIIEYVSWEVLEEKGSSEEVVREAFLKAFELNPFIAVFIAAHESFFQSVEYIEDIKDPKVGSIEESFVYCANNIGVWLDTVGACAWIEKELAELPEPVATAEHCSDEMYLGMYETAVEMHKEALAEGEDDEDASEEEDEGDDYDEPEETE
ncbi:hypothetical protein Poli38472_007411 [Pythium oligandrum]|uniref:Uncharacterized protein n=1 Tax=Pythium oligandrum TaxID=41045 RepID=A0A8K1FNW0_PYTOL|nr:hypothetical protein Poli38472_007411 [Pythium oligandrum]|eukprot:TMW67739.1 hypothetical protein Poli38472_007411 [Pythium oligandrum]